MILVYIGKQSPNIFGGLTDEKHLVLSYKRKKIEGDHGGFKHHLTMHSFLTAVLDLPYQNLVQKRVEHDVPEVHCRVTGVRECTRLFNANTEDLKYKIHIRIPDMN